MNDVYERVKAIFAENGVDYKEHEHEAVYTSEEAARSRGVELRTGVKALVCRAADRFILVLVPADRKADLVKIASLERVGKVKLASPEEVFKITGCRIGSVPPFGHRTKLKTYFDKAILANETVNFNIGLHTKSASLRAKDLMAILESELKGQFVPFGP